VADARRAPHGEDPKLRIVLESDALLVRFAPWERLMAVRWRELRIPRTAIRQIERSVPPPTLKQLRAPGTHVPGLIKAGSYYTSRGKEFWFVTFRRKAHPITISLTGLRYAQVVLGFSTGETPERIESWWSAAVPPG
jgi:hypothetical protein